MNKPAAKPQKQLPYVIVRTYSAGVFAGRLLRRSGKEATLLESRRLWYWSGAATLHQLAEEGVKNPLECKFVGPLSLPHDITEVIEVLRCTVPSATSICGVVPWRV